MIRAITVTALLIAAIVFLYNIPRVYETSLGLEYVPHANYTGPVLYWAHGAEQSPIDVMPMIDWTNPPVKVVSLDWTRISEHDIRLAIAADGCDRSQRWLAGYSLGAAWAASFAFDDESMFARIMLDEPAVQEDTPLLWNKGGNKVIVRVGTNDRRWRDGGLDYARRIHAEPIAIDAGHGTIEFYGAVGKSYWDIPKPKE